MSEMNIAFGATGQIIGYMNLLLKGGMESINKLELLLERFAKNTSNGLYNFCKRAIDLKKAQLDGRIKEALEIRNIEIPKECVEQFKAICDRDGIAATISAIMQPDGRPDGINDAVSTGKICVNFMNYDEPSVMQAIAEAKFRTGYVTEIPLQYAKDTGKKDFNGKPLGVGFANKCKAEMSITKMSEDKYLQFIYDMQKLPPWDRVSAMQLKAEYGTIEFGFMNRSAPVKYHTLDNKDIIVGGTRNTDIIKLLLAKQAVLEKSKYYDEISRNFKDGLKYRDKVLNAFVNQKKTAIDNIKEAIENLDINDDKKIELIDLAEKCFDNPDMQVSFNKEIVNLEIANTEKEKIMALSLKEAVYLNMVNQKKEELIDGKFAKASTEMVLVPMEIENDGLLDEDGRALSESRTLKSLRNGIYISTREDTDEIRFHEPDKSNAPAFKSKGNAKVELEEFIKKNTPSEHNTVWVPMTREEFNTLNKKEKINSSEIKSLFYADIKDPLSEQAKNELSRAEEVFKVAADNPDLLDSDMDAQTFKETFGKHLDEETRDRYVEALDEVDEELQVESMDQGEDTIEDRIQQVLDEKDEADRKSKDKDKKKDDKEQDKPTPVLGRDD